MKAEDQVEVGKVTWLEEIKMPSITNLKIQKSKSS